MEYAWVDALLAEIISDARQPMHSMLNGSPLRLKLLLAHRAVFKLLHSLVLRDRFINALVWNVPTNHEKREMQKKIVCVLMHHTTLYYIDSVQRHSEFVYNENTEDTRTQPKLHVPLRAHTNATGILFEDNAQHASRIAAHPLQYTRLTWPLRDLNYYTRLGLSLSEAGLQGAYETFPHMWTLAHSGILASEEETLFDFLQYLQDQDVLHKTAREAQFEKGLELSSFPLAVPAAVVEMSSCAQVRHGELLAQCIAGTDLASYSTTHGEKCSENKALLLAYRWKGMLIMTTLLSALNGICQEMKNTSTVPHHIHAFVVAGPEFRPVGIDLVLQNFRFTEQCVVCRRISAAPLMAMNPHFSRQNVQFLFRARHMVGETLGIVAADPTHINLSKCLQNNVHYTKGRRHKKVWRKNSTIAATYLCESAGAYTATLEDWAYSWRIEGLTSTVPNDMWYQFARA